MRVARLLDAGAPREQRAQHVAAGGAAVVRSTRVAARERRKRAVDVGGVELAPRRAAGERPDALVDCALDDGRQIALPLHRRREADPRAPHLVVAVAAVVAGGGRHAAKPLSSRARCPGLEPTVLPEQGGSATR